MCAKSARSGRAALDMYRESSKDCEFTEFDGIGGASAASSAAGATGPLRPTCASSLNHNNQTKTGQSSRQRSMANSAGTTKTTFVSSAAARANLAAGTSFHRGTTTTNIDMATKINSLSEKLQRLGSKHTSTQDSLRSATKNSGGSGSAYVTANNGSSENFNHRYQHLHQRFHRPHVSTPYPSLARAHTMTDLSAEEFNKFIKLKQVGRGAYGGVHQVQYKGDNEIYAMKIIDIDQNSTESSLNSGSDHRKDTTANTNAHLMNEIMIMKQFNHKNVVKLYHYHLNATSMNLIMEYCEGGSLRDRYKAKGPLPELEVVGYTREILEGLVYLHGKGFIHSDIKAANILLRKGTIKLADFGVSIKKDLADGLDTARGGASKTKKEANGSPYWMAPEVIKLEGVSRASDIWSLGATIVELLTTQPPFYQHDPFPACHAIGSGELPELPSGVSRECTRFLELGCFQRERKDRPTAENLLKHPWIIDSTSPAGKQNSGGLTTDSGDGRKGHLNQYNESFQDNYDNDFDDPSVNFLSNINTVTKKQRLDFYKESNQLDSEDDFIDAFDADDIENLKAAKLKPESVREQKRKYIRGVVTSIDAANLEDLQLLNKYFEEEEEDDEEEEEEDEEEDEEDDEEKGVDEAGNVKPSEANHPGDKSAEKLKSNLEFVVALLKKHEFVYKLTARLQTEDVEECKMELIKIAVKLFEKDTQCLVDFYHCGAVHKVIEMYSVEKSVLKFIVLLVKTGIPTISVISIQLTTVLVELLTKGDAAQQEESVDLLLDLFRNDNVEKKALASILVHYSTPEVLSVTLCNIHGHINEKQEIVVTNIVKLLAKITCNSWEFDHERFMTVEFLTCLFRKFNKLPFKSKLEIVRIIERCGPSSDKVFDSLDSSRTQQIFDQLMEDISSYDSSRTYEKFAKCTIPIIHKLCSLDKGRQSDLLSSSSIDLFNYLINVFSSSKKNESIRGQVVSLFMDSACNPDLLPVCKRFGGVEILINVLDDAKFRLRSITAIRDLIRVEEDSLDETLKKKQKLIGKFVASFKIDKDIDKFIDIMIEIAKHYHAQGIRHPRRQIHAYNIYKYMCSSEEILNSLYARLSQPELVNPVCVLQLFKILYERTPLTYILREFRPVFEELKEELMSQVGDEDDHLYEMIELVDSILDER